MKFSGLKEYVYHEIKKRLMTSKIKQGERIWEEAIAQELDVSRTPVREAINRLIAEGFVENRPRKGVFAAEISKHELHKMLDVRVVLEALSVRRCCRLITEEEINELSAIYEKYRGRLKTGDFAEASQLDSEIHRFIALVSDNKKLASYINDIQDFFAYTRACTVKWTETNVDRSLKDHLNLIEAISRRDEEGAVDLIEKDIQSMRELLS
jgi:DNA-binding GntR family transcriptional regulator